MLEKIKRVLKPFQNIKFNISLFAALAVASLLGTIIPQIPENPDKVEEFLHNSPKLGFMFEKLELFNIYYSWWFVGFLGLLAFDVVVCKLIFGKFPGLRTFKNVEREPDVTGRQSFSDSWTTNQPASATAARLTELLRKRKYFVRVQSSLENGGSLLLASRHRIQRFGSWVSHVSILVILLANFAGALYGFRETVSIPEGGSHKLKNRDWVLTCDKFLVEWYTDSDTPRTFASDLRLFVNGHVTREQKIMVNEPMEHKKVRFYQANYGPTLKEAYRHISAAIEAISVGDSAHGRGYAGAGHRTLCVSCSLRRTFR